MNLLEEINKAWYMLADKNHIGSFRVSNLLWLGLICLETWLLWDVFPRTIPGTIIFGVTIIILLFLFNPIIARRLTSLLIKQK